MNVDAAGYLQAAQGVFMMPYESICHVPEALKIPLQATKALSLISRNFQLDRTRNPHRPVNPQSPDVINDPMRLRFQGETSHKNKRCGAHSIMEVLRVVVLTFEVGNNFTRMRVSTLNDVSQISNMGLRQSEM